jgi:hypothetical protein
LTTFVHPQATSLVAAEPRLRKRRKRYEDS